MRAATLRARALGRRAPAAEAHVRAATPHARALARRAPAAEARA